MALAGAMPILPRAAQPGPQAGLRCSRQRVVELMGAEQGIAAAPQVQSPPAAQIQGGQAIAAEPAPVGRFVNETLASEPGGSARALQYAPFQHRLHDPLAHPGVGYHVELVSS